MYGNARCVGVVRESLARPVLRASQYSAIQQTSFIIALYVLVDWHLMETRRPTFEKTLTSGTSIALAPC